MNRSKTYIRPILPKPAPSTRIHQINELTTTIKLNPILPKPAPSTRIHQINESTATNKQNGNRSARTFIHIERKNPLNLTKSQGSAGIIATIPYFKRNVDGQGRKFSSTTIVNGSTGSHRQVHPSCANDRVVVLPVETLVRDDASAGDGNFKDPAIIKVKEIRSTKAEMPENCHITVQRECKLKQKPCPTKVAKLSSQKKSLPAAKSGGKRGLIRYGKSRMIADTHTVIPVAEYKAQLNDTVDIVAKMELAPPTKRMMHLLNTKGVNKLFALPGRIMGSKTSNLFVRHLTLKQTPADPTYDDMPLLPVGYKREIDKSKIKRITRKRIYPEAEEYQRNLYKQQLDHLHAMQMNAGDPYQCKGSIFINQDEIMSAGKDGSILLGSMDGMEVAMKEEEVLDGIMYQGDFKSEASISSESEEVCLHRYADLRYPVLLINERTGSEENIAGALLAAEKIGISQEEIGKVLIFRQEPDEDTNAPFYGKNENYTVTSWDPNEPEIVVS